MRCTLLFALCILTLPLRAQTPIPASFDYSRCSGLSREMVEKLTRVRPSTLGQASRIAGVTPAAVSLIQCFLEIQKRQRQAEARVA